jgi:sugar lactone lactonase YvrE
MTSSLPDRGRDVTEYARGHGFLEGPRWHDGRLYASSVRSRQILAFDGAGDADVIADLSDYPSGLGWAADGSLLVVGMSERRLLRIAADGHSSEVADLSQLSPGSLNDMLVTASGRAYIGALAADALSIRGPALDKPTGLICVEPSGLARPVGAGLHFPNGIAMTGDGGTLLVAETYAGRVSAFAVGADGTLATRTDWFVFDARPAEQNRGGYWATTPAPDGIALDQDDGLWVSDAGGNGVFRITADAGITEFVCTGALAVFAVALGGQDGRTLFMCAGPPSGNGPRNETLECRVLSCRVDVGGRFP